MSSKVLGSPEFLEISRVDISDTNIHGINGLSYKERVDTYPPTETRNNGLRRFIKKAGLATLTITGLASPSVAQASETIDKVTASTRKVACGPNTPLSRLPVLSYNNSGSCVSYAQRLLYKHGRLNSSQIVGNFGVITKGETRGFQIQNGITNTGNIGPKTWKALRRATSNHGLAPVCKTMMIGACVNKHAKTVTLIRHGRAEFSFGAQFGDPRGPQFRTDEGLFKVQSKNIDAVSYQYGNAPMPYAVFYNGGEAFHSYPDLLTPSHGCDHLLPNNARKTFYWVKVGDPVAVF